MNNIKDVTPTHPTRIPLEGRETSGGLNVFHLRMIHGSNTRLRHDVPIFLEKERYRSRWGQPSDGSDMWRENESHNTISMENQDSTMGSLRL